MKGAEILHLHIPHGSVLYYNCFLNISLVKITLRLDADILRIGPLNNVTNYVKLMKGAEILHLDIPHGSV